MSKIKSPHVCVDIEANGPLIGTHSMISLGAVVVEPGLERTFYAEIKPISDEYVPDALAISGFTHEQTMKFRNPGVVMSDFAVWLNENIKGRPIMWADNNGFDAPWINWYFLKFTQSNPFGHSSRRIADLICGLQKDLRYKWKFLRNTPHTHNALDDAKANASVMLKLESIYGLNIYK